MARKSLFAAGNAEALIEKMRRSLSDVTARRQVEVEAATRRLRVVMKEERAAAALVVEAEQREGRLPPAPRMKRISIMLEPWQIEAAKLLATIQGGTYQERVRLWVDLGIRAEAGGPPVPVTRRARKSRRGG